MTRLPNTPSREAIILNLSTDRPSLDFDPIMLDVDLAGMADAFSEALMGAVDAVDMAAADNHVDYALVWSDAPAQAVRFLCPNCDDVAIAHDSVISDDEEGSWLVCPECSD